MNPSKPIDPQLAADRLIIRVFLEETVRTLQEIQPMMGKEAHSEVCRRYYRFLAYRIPGFEAAFTQLNATTPPSLRSRLGKLVPRFARKWLGSLYAFMWVFDALLFPAESVSARMSLRFRIAQRIPPRIRRLHFAQWIDRVLLRRGWESKIKSAKSLFEITSSDIEQLASATAQSNSSKLQSGRNVAGRLDADSRDVYVFVSHLFPTTWSPLVRELNARGKHTVWCGTDDARVSEGYGVLETSLIGTTSIAIEEFLGILALLCTTKRCQILMSGECFYGSNWNAEDTTVLYSLLSSVLATMCRLRQADKNLCLLMYDGLKPIHASSSNENTAIGHTYKKLMRLADRIIYNSNTELLGDFNRFSIPLPTPRLHFYRYSETPRDPKPRMPFDREQNIHMACITVCLEEFGEPSRDQVARYVRSIIMQRIHFHYYCIIGHPVIEAFERSLGEYKKYLHLHAIIKDQRKLVEDLHQYHVGFNPSDHVPFARGIASLNDRFYQDGMATFLQSTIGTSFLVYAAAGLPVLLPRGCTGAANLLGEVAIPIIFSEMGNMRDVLMHADLERRHKLADERAEIAHIGTHIPRFLKFFESRQGHVDGMVRESARDRFNGEASVAGE